MTMLGVTGTNGKTTTTYLLEAIVRAGRACARGVIGTTGARIDGTPVPWRGRPPRRRTCTGCSRAHAR